MSFKFLFVNIGGLTMAWKFNPVVRHARSIEPDKLYTEEEFIKLIKNIEREKRNKEKTSKHEA